MRNLLASRVRHVCVFLVVTSIPISARPEDSALFAENRVDGLSSAHERSQTKESTQDRHANYFSRRSPGKACLPSVSYGRSPDTRSLENIIKNVAQAGPHSRIPACLKRDFSKSRRVGKEFERRRRIVEQMPRQLQPVPVAPKYASLGRVHVRYQDVKNSPWLQPFADSRHYTTWLV